MIFIKENKQEKELKKMMDKVRKENKEVLKKLAKKIKGLLNYSPFFFFLIFF